MRNHERVRKRFQLQAGRFAAALASIALLAGGAHAQLFAGGNLLPGTAELPKTSAQIQNTAGNVITLRNYVSGGRQGFTADVMCSAILVGTLDFQYAPFTGDNSGSASSNDKGGMAIRGGFILNPNVTLAPNISLRWVQAYQETGGTANNLVDIRAGATEPFYVNFTVPGIDTALVDIPFDTFTAAGTEDTLRFESSLVCVNSADPKNLISLGSFQWFYSLDKTNKTIFNEGVTGFSPTLTSLLTAPFNNQFGPSGTVNSGWSLQTTGCTTCFAIVAAPEPTGGYWVLGAGCWMVGTAVRRMRRRVSEQ